MNILKRVSFWFNLFITLVTVSFVIMALSYGPRERLFPLIIGIPTALAGIVMLASEKWPKLLKPFDVNIGLSVKIIEQSIDEEEKVEGPAKVDITTRETTARIFTAGAWMAGYIIVVILTGFNLANFLLPTLYIKIHAKSAWWKAILIGALTAITMWAMFEWMMKAQMWGGILPPPFGKSEILPPL